MFFLFTLSLSYLYVEMRVLSATVSAQPIQIEKITRKTDLLPRTVTSQFNRMRVLAAYPLWSKK